MLANKLLSGTSVVATPLFRSVESAYVTNGNINLNKPTGTTEGDLLVVMLSCVDVNNFLTSVPTGFTLQLGNINTDSMGKLILVKTATASEPTSYNFVTSNTGDRIFGAMMAYESATKIELIGTINNSGNITTLTAPSITSLNSGELIAWFSTDANTATVTTPPSGMVSVIESEHSQNTNHIFRETITSGVTGDRTIIVDLASNSNESLLFHISSKPITSNIEFIATALTHNSGSDTPVTVNKPTGTQEGDLMLAVMGRNDASTTWTQPSEWTEIVDQNAGVAPSLGVAYKIAGASEPTTYDFTPSSPKDCVVGIVTMRGVSYDSVSTISTTNPNVILTPTLSNTDSELIVIGMRDATSSTYTCYGMTTRLIDDGSISPNFVIASNTQASGNAGNRTIDMNGAGSTGVSLILNS